jgi:hypothetical protein
MKPIIKRDDFKITQDDKNENSFSIIFDINSELLIRSISNTKIILGMSISDNYDLVSFNASSVESFKQYQDYSKDMSYSSSLKMVLDLSLQLNYLQKNYSTTFLGYNPDNLIVVDGNKFIYISNEHLIDIDDEEEITITFPFSQNDFFMSPELCNIKELPAKVHYKTAYFSLGTIIIIGQIGNIGNIGNIDFLSDEPDKPIYKKMIDILERLSIKGTKLYWLLKRCLDEEPKRRNIIFI